MKIIVIDNYDSFVYNICDYIGRLHLAEIEVYRNDVLSVDEILNKSPDGIVISPGPGEPENAGISVELIKKVKSDIPLLGVCLGHQSIAVAFGGKVTRARRILHGKTSHINHSGTGIFKDIKNPFLATRYHSLIVQDDDFPGVLQVTARTSDDEIMAMEHKEFPIWGVQFHPESILTEFGLKLIENFIDIVSCR